MSKSIDDLTRGWADSLAKSEAQLDAGDTVSGTQIINELRDGIARLETKLDASNLPEAASRR